MLYDIRVINWNDCLHLDAQGHFDFDATQRFFRDAIWACAKSRISRILLDVRDATADLTSTQLAKLAVVAANVAPPEGQHKIAILTRPEAQFTNALFVADKAQDQGWNIAAFQEFESALNWLAGAGSTPWPDPRPYTPDNLKGPDPNNLNP